MRLFRNLSVGRKLAASAAAAILFLALLVGVVQVQLEAAGTQQEAVLPFQIITTDKVVNHKNQGQKNQIAR